MRDGCGKEDSVGIMAIIAQAAGNTDADPSKWFVIGWIVIIVLAAFFAGGLVHVFGKESPPKEYDPYYDCWW